MADPRVAKLADLLVNYSLQLAAGQMLRIDAGTVAAPLVTESYRSALRAGANPRTRIEVEGLDVIAVGESNDDQLVFALTTSPAFDYRGVSAGDASGSVCHRIAAKKVLQRGGVAVLGMRSRSRTLLIGLDRKHVRFLAVAVPRASVRAINAWLDASR